MSDYPLKTDLEIMKALVEGHTVRASATGIFQKIINGSLMMRCRNSDPWQSVSFIPNSECALIVDANEKLVKELKDAKD